MNAFVNSVVMVKMYNLLRLSSSQSIRAGMQAVTHHTSQLLAMTQRQPEASPAKTLNQSWDYWRRIGPVVCASESNQLFSFGRRGSP
jgi:hypothetical protein